MATQSQILWNAWNERLEIKRLSFDLVKQEQAFQNLKNKAQTTQQKITQLNTELSENTHLQSHLEGKLKQLGTMIQRTQTALEQGKIPDYDSAEQQIKDAKKRIDDVENQLLDLIDSEETLEQRIISSKTLLQMHKARALEAWDLVVLLRADKQELQPKHFLNESEFISQLPAPLEQKYRALCDKHPNLVTRVIDQHCSACGYHIPGLDFRSLKTNQTTEFCQGCRSFLVYIEE
ncbi:MAG: hypothetical protein CMK59_08800 [Proteobacteria bacterium]|nr:hypothetical protein [Pseudomonadota bacterium]